jgi:sugar lactone lactonase YvrE
MGIGAFRGDGRAGTEAMYYADGGTNIVFGPDGSLYFSEPEFQVIRRLRPDGIVERVAGTGERFDNPDGALATKTRLNRPRGLAFDRDGNLLFTESFSVHRIRRIDKTTGIVTTVAGSSMSGFSGDGGRAAEAKLNNPTDLAADRDGNVYVLDYGNARIRRIDRSGIITTIAGTGTQGFAGDGGPATAATFNVGVYDNGGLAVDSRGNVYLADTYNGRVRKIDIVTGIITTFVADAGTVYGVTVDKVDNVYVAFNKLGPHDTRIQKFTPNAQLERSWGRGFGFSDDGTEVDGAAMGLVWRVLVEADGNVLFADAGRVRRINLRTGRLETILGILPRLIGEKGPALATTILGVELLFLPTGELLTGEVTNYVVRKMDRGGNLSLFARNGSLTSAPIRDGAKATDVSMDAAALALTPSGDVLLVVLNGICRIDTEGRIHRLTAIGNNGFVGDGGPAINAQFLQPSDLAVDRAGNVFVADSNNNRIRRIDAVSGIVTTVAGSGPGNGVEGHGRGSYCGDGGPATAACLNTPMAVAVAQDGSIFIGEGSSILQFTGELIDRIRKVDSSGTITTFARFPGIKRMRFNDAGNLFMGGLRIQPNGHMYKIIGDAPPSPTDNGDGGPAASAHCYGFGIAIDADGNLFCSDPGTQRVRAVRLGAVIAEPGSSITVVDGNAQGTPLGTTFERSLTVALRSSAGTLENGIRVDFIAPKTGPSCVFPSGTSTYSTLTDVTGRAAARCTATGSLGSYAVVATPLALGSSVQFALSNATPPPRRRSVRH